MRTTAMARLGMKRTDNHPRGLPLPRELAVVHHLHQGSNREARRKRGQSGGHNAHLGRFPSGAKATPARLYTHVLVEVPTKRERDRLVRRGARLIGGRMLCVSVEELAQAQALKRGAR